MSPDLDTLVSVVVPAYNAARTLDATLASARAQTHRALEIIVVDDGSTDATVDLAERHAAQDPRVRVVRQPNGGPSAARNHGLRQSRGVFVAPLDADDLWRAERIERLLAALRAAGPDAASAYNLSWMIDSEDRIVGARGEPGFGGLAFLRSILVNSCGNGSAVMMRRDALARIGGYDVALGRLGAEDRLVQSLLARLGPVAEVREHLTGYRQLPESYSKDNVRMLLGQLGVFERLRVVVPEAPVEVYAAAEASARIRLAVAQTKRRRLGPALTETARALRLAPGLAIEVVARDLLRAVRKALRRARAAPPGPLFHEADTLRSYMPIDPLAGRRMLAALVECEAALAASPVNEKALAWLRGEPVGS